MSAESTGPTDADHTVRIATGSATFDQLACRVTLQKANGSRADLDMNDYLRGVVPSEMPAYWGGAAAGGQEALKAQAVAARTYAARVQAIRGYLTAGESDQVWNPVYYDATDRAVAETGYQILASGGEAALAYYSSTCGGHGADGGFSYLTGRRCNAAAERWNLSSDPAALDFLQSIPDAFCKSAGAELYRWQTAWDRATLETILDTYLPLVPDYYRSAPYQRGNLGTLISLAVLARDVSGKINVLRVTGYDGTAEHSWDIDHEYWIRSLLRADVNANPQYSAMVALTFDRNPDGNIGLVRAYGGGYGHGMGMCQYGAYGMAKAGYDYRGILDHYYNGAALIALPACVTGVSAQPEDGNLCRPGDLVTYSWSAITGAQSYKIEVLNRAGQVVSVSAVLPTNVFSTTLPAPGPADIYTWRLVANLNGTDVPMFIRTLTTTDHLYQAYSAAVLNGK